MGAIVGINQPGQASWLEEKQTDTEMDDVELDDVEGTVICEGLGGDSQVLEIANSTDNACYRY